MLVEVGGRSGRGMREKGEVLIKKTCALSRAKNTISSSEGAHSLVITDLRLHVIA